MRMQWSSSKACFLSNDSDLVLKLNVDRKRMNKGTHVSVRSERFERSWHQGHHAKLHRLKFQCDKGKMMGSRSQEKEPWCTPRKISPIEEDWSGF